MSTTDVRRSLTGGDRRSQARSRQVLDRVLAGDRGPIGELAALATTSADEDWLVSMRAVDLLEKIAFRHAAWRHSRWSIHVCVRPCCAICARSIVRAARRSQRARVTSANVCRPVPLAGADQAA